MADPLPNFLILGAQKCATSWLHHHLSQHPKVFMPETKELEYFSYSEHLTRIGSDGYAQNFREAGQVQWIGEATASYFWSAATPPMWGAQLPGFNPAIPEAIRELLGSQVKLIVSLRDPVERAISAYLHHIAHGAIDARQALLQAGVEFGIVSMGFYAAHLQRFLECFAAEQILVLIMEQDIVREPALGLNKVADFLDIDPQPWLEPEHQPLTQPVFPGTARTLTEQGVVLDSQVGASALVADRDALNLLRITYGRDLLSLQDLLQRDLGNHWPLALGND